MKYFVIGDEDTVLGFSLAGISGVTVTNAEEAEAAWEKVRDNRDVGVIIITEPAAGFIREKVDSLLYSDSFPLVVEIPEPGKTSSRDLRALVNEAIGVSI